MYDFSLDTNNVCTSTHSMTYSCYFCGKRWILKDATFSTDLPPSAVNENVSQGDTNNMELDDDYDFNNNGPYTLRACAACRVSRHRSHLKNPLLSHFKTGVMSPIIRDTKYDDVNNRNNMKELYHVTYNQFWLSEYCIRADCIRKAKFYGFCKTCYLYCANLNKKSRIVTSENFSSSILMEQSEKN